MQFLPLVVSLIVAAAVAPAVVRGLRARGLVRENYRGRSVAFPAGVALVAAVVVALIPLALLEEALGGVFTAGALRAVLYVIGVALLGLLDDLLGSGALVARGTPPEAPPRAPGHAARGWRGHARAAAAGAPSTGVLKAVGSLGLALFALGGQGMPFGEYVLAVGLLVLTTNLFNLLDLRPGRSIKALALLGLGLTLGSINLDPLLLVGLFLGPLVVLFPLDLRERAMLGDTGSNAVGAVAGLWLVLALAPLGQGIALALVAVATVYGEFRSISSLIDRTPGLRQLDSLGRISHA